MRLGALVPTLALGAALLAPALAEADHHRSSERGRAGYHRSGRGYGERYSPRGRYDRGHHRSYRHDRGRYYRSHRRPYYRPHHRPYYRPYRRPYYYAPRHYRPAPPVSYAPRPVPYGYYGGPVWGPPRRGGLHGSVSVGLPFLGFSLYF
jgi:hypothetical protein